jgi:hypothetical protein
MAYFMVVEPVGRSASRGTGCFVQNNSDFRQARQRCRTFRPAGGTVRVRTRGERQAGPVPLQLQAWGRVAALTARRECSPGDAAAAAQAL